MLRGSGLRLGIIGLGSMGRHYVRLAAELSGLRLSALSDLDPAAGEMAASSLGVPFFPDYQNLLELVEAVCIITPAQTHFRVASDCLNAGKHVLLEKPFTLASKTAQELKALAAEKQLIIGGSFLERFNPAFKKLLTLIKGEKLHGIDIKRFSPFPDRIGDADVVFDMMIHDLDLLLHLTADEIVDIKASGEAVRSGRLDRVVATFTHKAGIISRVHSNRVYNDKVRHISVTTDKQIFEADLLNKRIFIRDFSAPQPSTVPVKENNQLAEQLADFVSAIKHSRAPIVTADDSIRALLLTEGVEKAC